MTPTPPTGARVLRVDSSARLEGSNTRTLTGALVQRLLDTGAATDVIERDVAREPLPFVDAAWVGANLTPAETRDAAQRERLAQSEALVEELFAADFLVIGAPVYNFGVPAALKAWIDQIARARRTFRYTESGPEGLLVGKRAWVCTSSGGTAADGDMDFSTPYLRHVLGFVGIDDVTVIAADRAMARGDEAMDEALAEIASHVPERAA